MQVFGGTKDTSLRRLGASRRFAVKDNGDIGRCGTMPNSMKELTTMERPQALTGITSVLLCQPLLFSMFNNTEPLLPVRRSLKLVAVEIRGWVPSTGAMESQAWSVSRLLVV